MHQYAYHSCVYTHERLFYGFELFYTRNNEVKWGIKHEIHWKMNNEMNFFVFVWVFFHVNTYYYNTLENMYERYLLVTSNFSWKFIIQNNTSIYFAITSMKANTNNVVDNKLNWISPKEKKIIQPKWIRKKQYYKWMRQTLFIRLATIRINFTETICLI